jgi:hypothetical protein
MLAGDAARPEAGQAVVLGLADAVNRSKMEGRANNSRKRKEANQG